MRVISNKALVDFAANNPRAEAPLQAWRKLVEERSFNSFAELKSVFNSVDRVAGYYVFDIAGNNYRIIAAIHFDKDRLYVRRVLTHIEYDKWKP